MKKLILIRHAEAESSFDESADFNRPLTASGKKNAAKMAALLLKQATLPQIFVSSPALRAIGTAHIFTNSLSLDNAKTNAEIYEADSNTLLEIINKLNESFTAVALVGHNPGVSNLLYYLTGKITTMPTSSWVEVALQADTWTEVSGDAGELLQYQYP